jgi:hypothetical protein
MEQFRGFTPEKSGSWLWNGEFGSESSLPKADPSLRIFLLRLKNPHNFPFQFALKAEKNRHTNPYYPSAFPFFDGRLLRCIRGHPRAFQPGSIQRSPGKRFYPGMQGVAADSFIPFLGLYPRITAETERSGSTHRHDGIRAPKNEC